MFSMSVTTALWGLWVHSCICCGIATDMKAWTLSNFLKILQACCRTWLVIPGPGLCLGIYVELLQKVLDIALILDGQKASLEVLRKVHIIASVSLNWWLSASSTY